MGASASYEAAGVNLEAGDDASEIFKQITMATSANRAGEFGEPQIYGDDIRAARGTSLEALFELKQRYPEIKMGRHSCADGVGNKPRSAEMMGEFDTIGIDLVAMSTDDASAAGAEPLGITNILVVNTLGKKSDHPNKQERIRRNVFQLAMGLANGSNTAQIVVENGEIAEHGDTVGGYGEFRIDWSAVVNYFYMEERLIDGKKITPGAAVVALADEGFGCNGYSLLLEQLAQIYGNEWHRQEFGEDSTWGAEVLRPTRIYTGLFTAITGGYRPNVLPSADVQTIVHNTGGGIFGKGASKFSGSGCGMELTDLFDPNPAMSEFQRLTGIEDEELYHVLHMGQRGLVVTMEPDKVIDLAAARGIPAKIAGETTNKPEIVIHSRGNTHTNQRLVHPIPQ